MVADTACSMDSRAQFLFRLRHEGRPQSLWPITVMGFGLVRQDPNASPTRVDRFLFLRTGTLLFFWRRSWPFFFSWSWLLFYWLFHKWYTQSLKPLKKPLIDYAPIYKDFNNLYYSSDTNIMLVTSPQITATNFELVELPGSFKLRFREISIIQGRMRSFQSRWFIYYTRKDFLDIQTCDRTTFYCLK